MKQAKVYCHQVDYPRKMNIQHEVLKSVYLVDRYSSDQCQNMNTTTIPEALVCATS